MRLRLVLAVAAASAFGDRNPLPGTAPTPQRGRRSRHRGGMVQAEMLARFAREGDFDCPLLAGRYTLIDHTGLRELLPTCERKGISLIIGGHTTAEYWPQVRAPERLTTMSKLHRP